MVTCLHTPATKGNRVLVSCASSPPSWSRGRTPSPHVSWTQRPVRYRGSERKSNRLGCFQLEKARWKGKGVGTHGKDEEGTMVLVFVIRY